MGLRERYTPGTFSWVELSTPDQRGAKAFYAGLFGWETEDNPVGENAVYMMAKHHGHYVAAIAPQPSQQQEAGVPPLWNNYITVESADRAAERARHLGAQVHAGPFDVMDVGRMAVIQDPQGGFFMVWEPRQHIGAGLVNASGALTWNELATPDMDGSAQFYRELFDWKTEAVESGGAPYMTIRNAEGWLNGGIRRAAGPEPTYWLAYFGTDDLEASTAKAEELGGRKLMGPLPVGPGTIAVVSDPQGAVFTLYQGSFED